MSHYTTDLTFCFNDWLSQNNLLKYKQVFIDCKMTDLASLDVNNSSFATLITDPRLNGNDLIVQNIVKSIQLLRIQHTILNTTSSNNKCTYSDHMKALIEEQQSKLNKLIITQNKNKQKYNKYFFQRNENKLTDYIQKLKITKINITKSFDLLRELINKEEKRILNETLKQQTNALYIQSNIDNNKKKGNPIKHKLHLNDTLIENYTKLLENTLQFSNNKNVNIIKSENLKNKFDNIFSDINKNNENIQNVLTECDYCTLSMPQINQIIYNKISENICNIANFNFCCPITINIINVFFMNANSIRILFTISPQRDFKQCEVYYNYNSENESDEKQECHWYKSTNITSLLYKENNENSMIVELNCINNKKYYKYLNIKIRFHRICDNEWSQYSNIYTIINEIFPPTEKIKNIFYVSSDLHTNHKGLYIACNDTNISNSCNIFELNSPNILTTRLKEKWLIKDSGICYGKRILLPESVRNTVNEIYNCKQKRFNCLFKCGGTVGDTIATKYCSAIIFNDINENLNNIINEKCITQPLLNNTMRTVSTDYVSTPTIKSELSKSKTFVLNWGLPLLPNGTDCNDITYSQYYGLLSCGGWEFHNNSNKFYRLPFNNEEYFQQNNNWKWEIMPNMKIKRSWPTILMIDSENKLIAIGGKGPINSVEMFNFKTMKWMNLNNINYARNSAGIVYDKLFNRIYIGGGYNALNKIERYDLFKDKWYCDLPNTKKSHASYPILWCGQNSNLLYIASIYSNSMEYCDLRMKNEKYFNIVYGQNYNRLWERVFGTKFAKVTNCRLCLS